MFDMIVVVVVVVVVLLMMLMLLLLPLLLLLLLFFAVNDDAVVTCFCYKAERLKHFTFDKRDGVYLTSRIFNTNVLPTFVLKF